MTSNIEKELTGVKGWLKVLCIYLTICSPLFLVLYIIKNYIALEQSINYLFKYNNVIFFVILKSIVVTLEFLSGVFIWKKKIYGIILYKYTLLLKLLLRFIISIIYYFDYILSNNDYDMTSIIILISSFTYNIIVFIIPWQYIKKSLRIRYIIIKSLNKSDFKNINILLEIILSSCIFLILLLNKTFNGFIYGILPGKSWIPFLIDYDIFLLFGFLIFAINFSSFFIHSFKIHNIIACFGFYALINILNIYLQYINGIVGNNSLNTIIYCFLRCLEGFILIILISKNVKKEYSYKKNAFLFILWYLIIGIISVIANIFILKKIEIVDINTELIDYFFKGVNAFIIMNISIYYINIIKNLKYEEIDNNQLEQI